MTTAGFETTISADERQQTYALDRTGQTTLQCILTLSFLCVGRDFVVGTGEKHEILFVDITVFSACSPFPLVNYVFRQIN